MHNLNTCPSKFTRESIALPFSMNTPFFFTQASDKHLGLSTQEAKKRLAQEGYNELPQAHRRGFYRIAKELLTEPMVYLLLLCGLLYLFLGDKHEALMLLGFLLLILGITLYQARKAERALEILRDLSSRRTLVIRDGQRVRIASREVVRGDILLLHEGDKVPSDVVVLSTLNFFLDESFLTGESVPVVKFPSAPKKASPSSLAYAGTTVVRGSALAQSIRVGSDTEFGKMGLLLKKEMRELTPFEQDVRKLVTRMALIAGALCIVVCLIYSLRYHSWLGGFLLGLTLAMAILPNELPSVVTVFFALGAWRLSKQGVLTRRAAAIEALGRATVLCVDKTGTLTYNKMTLKKLFCGESYFTVENQSVLPEMFHELVEYGVLAVENNPSDPMDTAMKRTGYTLLEGTEHLHPDWGLMKQYPLSMELLAVSHVWSSTGGRYYPVAAKGAPEAIEDLCHWTLEKRTILPCASMKWQRRGFAFSALPKRRSLLRYFRRRNTILTLSF